MAAEKAKILEAALALGPTERQELLNALVDSLEPDGTTFDQDEWDAVWGAELKRRADDLEAGRTKTFAHEEVFVDLRARAAKP